MGAGWCASPGLGGGSARLSDGCVSRQELSIKRAARPLGRRPVGLAAAAAALRPQAAIILLLLSPIRAPASLCVAAPDQRGCAGQQGPRPGWSGAGHMWHGGAGGQLARASPIHLWPGARGPAPICRGGGVPARRVGRWPTAMRGPVAPPAGGWALARRAGSQAARRLVVCLSEINTRARI